MEIENKPPDNKVVYIDEYPELAKRVWLRRLNRQRQLGNVATLYCEVYVLPKQPDEPA
jgi:hypothetical protein